MKATVSSVHFCSALIIRRSALCTNWDTFSRFHIIFVAFPPIINAVIITYATRQYRCTKTLATLRIISVEAIHKGWQNLTPQQSLGRSRCFLRYKLPYTAKRIRSGKRNPLHSLRRGNTGSYTVHERFYVIFKATNDQKSHIPDRHTVTDGGLALTLLTWRIWWAPENASRWQMGAFKGLDTSACRFRNSPRHPYKEHRTYFPRINQPGRGTAHCAPFLSTAEAKQRLELYLHSPLYRHIML